MSLYLIESENIYFPQIRGYFKEIVSSYDNGNYRSAMVMLYSTIVCDLLLKLKELSEVYSDSKAEKILSEINQKRSEYKDSSWEWDLIKKIHTQTELLSDESFMLIEHIYDLRNFSAHPAINDDYELISPTAEMVVAYIRKALVDILIKPSVFADNIVNRMSDDIAAKKDLYSSDKKGFHAYLQRVYFSRMSEKMLGKVFKAFWKFTFIKTDGDQFVVNRVINRNVLENMASNYEPFLIQCIKNEQNYYSIAAEDSCLKNAEILFAHYPLLYKALGDTTKYEISHAKDSDDFGVIKWFVLGDLEKHLSEYNFENDSPSRYLLDFLSEICQEQGHLSLFRQFIIRQYQNSNCYIGARKRFQSFIEPYLEVFTADDFEALITAINGNHEIYEMFGQQRNNDLILKYAKDKLPSDFSFTSFEKFQYTHEESENENQPETDALFDSTATDEELPF